MSFSAAQFERLRLERGVTWGRPLRVLERTTSTNDLALAAISSDAKTGIVWLALEQTQGRGRRGRSWSAPPGECMMFSILLRYPGHLARLPGLSLVVGLCVRDAIVQRLPLCAHGDVRIKWPNDVLLRDKKLAGILLETRADRGHIGIALGVGLNVETRGFPAELADATSLCQYGLAPAQREQESLLVDLLGSLERRISRFFVQGLSPFLQELTDCDALAQTRIRVDGHEGIACGMDEQARLLVRTDSGHLTACASGHVVRL